MTGEMGPTGYGRQGTIDAPAGYHRKPFLCVERDRLVGGDDEGAVEELEGSIVCRRLRRRGPSAGVSAGSLRDPTSRPASLRLRVKGVVGREGALSASSRTIGMVSRPPKVRLRDNGTLVAAGAGACEPEPPSAGSRVARRMDDCVVMAGRVRGRSSRVVAAVGDASPSSGRAGTAAAGRDGDDESSKDVVGMAERVRRKFMRCVRTRLGVSGESPVASSGQEGSRLGRRCDGSQSTEVSCQKLRTVYIDELWAVWRAPSLPQAARRQGRVRSVRRSMLRDVLAGPHVRRPTIRVPILLVNCTV